MTAPRAARSDETGQRVYPVVGPDGLLVELPAWSTVSKKAAAPGLERWRANMMAEYAVTSEFIELVEKSPARAMEAIKSAPYEHTGKADIGSDVHAACEADDLGAPIELPARRDGANDVERLEALQPYLWQWQDLKARMRVEIVDVERTTFNLTHRMAGTADRLCVVPPLAEQLRPDGRPWQTTTAPVIGDIKTGKRVYPEVAMQLACYANAEGLISDHGDQVAPWDGIDRTVGVIFHLAADHWEVIPVDLVAAWEAAKGLARYAHFDREEARRTIGRPLRIPAPLPRTTSPAGGGEAPSSSPAPQAVEPAPTGTPSSPPPAGPILADDQAREQLRARLRALPADLRQLVLDSWPAGTPVLTRPGITVEQFLPLERMVTSLEERAAVDAPAGPVVGEGQQTLGEEGTTHPGAAAGPAHAGHEGAPSSPAAPLAEQAARAERQQALPPDIARQVDQLAIAAGVPHVTKGWTTDHLALLDPILEQAEADAGHRLRAVQAAASEAGMSDDERHGLAGYVTAGRTQSTRQLDADEAVLFRALAKRIANTDLEITTDQQDGDVVDARLTPTITLDLPAHAKARGVRTPAVTRQAQAFAEARGLPKPTKAADIDPSLHVLLWAWLDTQEPTA